MNRVGRHQNVGTSNIPNDRGGPSAKFLGPPQGFLERANLPIVVRKQRWVGIKILEPSNSGNFGFLPTCFNAIWPAFSWGVILTLGLLSEREWFSDEEVFSLQNSGIYFKQNGLSCIVQGGGNQSFGYVIAEWDKIEKWIILSRSWFQQDQFRIFSRVFLNSNQDIRCFQGLSKIWVSKIEKSEAR